MGNDIASITLRIGGMTCVSCQHKIQKKLLAAEGVHAAKVSYSGGTALVTYDAAIISPKDIAAVVRKLDYQVLGDAPSSVVRAAGLLLIIAALYLALEYSGVLNVLAPAQLAQSSMGYGMLFVIGLMTSVHCVAMCGGINLSQCLPRQQDAPPPSRSAAMRPALLYNLGRVAAYTATGFVVGALGSAISLTNTAQGVLKLIAGVFMVIMGVNMLALFPWLRKLTPRLPAFLGGKLAAKTGRSKSPLVIGLLNGFMPCGPLQAMQLYALSTGNPLSGAVAMLLFGLGTAPLMFGLSALSSLLSQKFTRKVMTAGAVLVAVLGLSMLSQGWSLSALGSGGGAASTASNAAGSAASNAASNAPKGVVIEDGVQIVNSALSSRRYPAITVQAGMPVQWTIDAPKGSINGCNNSMVIPEYGIEHEFAYGENVIEFTPAKPGIYPYSCWMGMIRSVITVVDDAA